MLFSVLKVEEKFVILEVPAGKLYASYHNFKKMPTETQLMKFENGCFMYASQETKQVKQENLAWLNRLTKN